MQEVCLKNVAIVQMPEETVLVKGLIERIGLSLFQLLNLIDALKNKY